MLDKLMSLARKPEADPDYEEDISAEVALVDRYVAEFLERRRESWIDSPLKELDTGAEIGKSDTETQCRVVMAALQKKQSNGPARANALNSNESAWETESALHELLRALLRRKLPFTSSQLNVLLHAVAKCLDDHYLSGFPFAGAMKALADYHARGDDLTELTPVIERVKKQVGRYADPDIGKYEVRLNAMLGNAPELPIRGGEGWTNAALAYYADVADDARKAWTELLEHCASANAGKPSKKWSTTAAKLVEAVGTETLVTVVPDWFTQIDAPRTKKPESHWYDDDWVMDECNAAALKGLIWVCGIVGDDRVSNRLGKVAMSTYKKVPGVGCRAPKIGNACVWALGQIPGESPLASLALLKVRVRYRPALKMIENALAAAAERAGMTPQELEEIGVPTYGMQDVGVRRETLGEYEAVLEIVNAKKTSLSWVNPTGKTVKSVPKTVRENHPDELKALRQAGKDLLAMLSAQRDRIDNLFLEQREWPFDEWHERYIDHPLLGTLGRRLIWSFEATAGQRSGIWHDGHVVDAQGKELDIGAGTSVRLWHPVGQATDDIVAWREFVESNEITQPFKQAHREIYLLTEAEENTETYSNRFASHIIKQHQFNALCAVRGWRNQLRLMVDNDYEPANIILPQWNLRAEFWVESIGDNFATDTTDSGTYLYLATDQVRFYHHQAAPNYVHATGGGYHTAGPENEANTPIPLRDIDPLVLSEVLRDVDLFVGVASVGNDPNWSDGGPEGRYVDYWNSYSFGDLGETAQMRKTILEKLIPRLKIRDRCEVTDKFLRVRGDIRTYKIHLGSGNVLMEPSDQYLCIVPAQGRAKRADTVFLPFEGDNRMSVILSKAFLLAEDTKIKDRTILSQIGI